MKFGRYSSWVAFCLCALLGFGGGWWWGRSFAQAQLHPNARGNASQNPPPRLLGANSAGSQKTSARLSLPSGAAQRGAAGLALGEVSLADLPAVLSEMIKRGQSRESADNMKLLMRRWGKNNPPAALEYANSVKSHSVRNVLLEGLVAGWAQGNFDQASAFIESTALNAPEKGNLWQAALRQLASSDVKRATDLANAHLTGDRRVTVLIEIAESGAETDPEGALKLLGEAPFSPARENCVPHLAEALLSKGDESARQILGTIKDKSFRESLVLDCMKTLAAADPDKAKKWIDSMAGDEKDKAVETFGQTWSMHDPAAAFAWLKSRADIPAEADVLAGAANAYGAAHPREALQMISASNNLTGLQMQTMIAGIAKSDPEAIIAWVADTNNAGHIREAIHGLCSFNINPGVAAKLLGNVKDPSPDLYLSVGSAWAQQDPEAARKWIAQLPAGDSKLMAASAAATALTTIDPKMCCEMISLAGDWQQKQGIIGDMMHQWSAKDPEAAINWAKNLPDPSARTGALKDSLPSWMVINQPEAMNYVFSLPTGEARDEMVHNAALLLTQKNANEALTWINGLQDQDVRITAMRGFCAIAAQTMPEEAAKLAISLPSGKDQSDLVGLIVNQWGTLEPTKAAAWVNGFAESGLRERAVGSLVSRWTESDREASLQWVSMLAAGNSRDAGIEAWVKTASYSTPALAASLAVQATDSQLRTDLISTTYRDWRKSDPGTAQSWLAGLKLTARDYNKIQGQK